MTSSEAIDDQRAPYQAHQQLVMEYSIISNASFVWHGLPCRMLLTGQIAPKLIEDDWQRTTRVI